jgi:hypothetical protein
VSSTVRDQGLEANVVIDAKASSSFVRAGTMTTRRYKSTITFPGRATASFAIFNTNDDPLLSREEMTERLPDLAMQVSLDKQRFALEIPPYARRIQFFHLLPNGEPLHLTAVDERLDVRELGHPRHRAWPSLLVDESHLINPELAPRRCAASAGEHV